MGNNGRHDVPAAGAQPQAKKPTGGKRGMGRTRRGKQAIQDSPEKSFCEHTSYGFAETNQLRDAIITFGDGLAEAGNSKVLDLTNHEVVDICAKPTSGVPFSNAEILWSKFKDGKLTRSCDSSNACKESRDRLCRRVESEGALQLALDATGCRDLQQVLELVDGETQESYANQLRDHVVENLESPHGNHVLQRFVEVLRPSASRFIFDELQRAFTAPELARHRYGCRVLERLIEHFPMEWLEEYLRPLFSEAIDLASDNYGNFVLQHVLEHGAPDQRRCIADQMKAHATVLALDQHACSVLDKALTYTVPADQLSIAKTLIYPELENGDHDLLSRMASLRGGFAAVGRVFKVVHGPDLAEATRQMEAFAEGDKVLKIKQGKTLLADIQKEILDKANLKIPSQAPEVPVQNEACSTAPERGYNLGKRKNKYFGARNAKLKNRNQYENGGYWQIYSF